MSQTGIYSTFIFFLSFLFFGCHTEGTHTHSESNLQDGDTHSEEEHSTSHTDIISITQKQFDASGFETGTLELKPFSTTLDVSGRIHLPQKNKAISSSLIGGTVSAMNLIHGQWVKKGQRLMTITNPALVDLQLEHLELQGKLTYLESEHIRLKQLADENITAKQNYLRAASEYKVTQSQDAATRRKLNLYGLDLNAISNSNLIANLEITAPISGYITEILILNGGFLQANAPAIEISNTSHLHAEFKILEKDISLLKKEQKVSFTIQGNSRKILKAHIHQIENHIDENRMINIHCHIDSNEGITLIEGMSIRGQVQLNNIEEYALPSESILTIEGRNYVLRQIENQKLQYEAIEVTIGKEANDYTQIYESEFLSNASIILTKGAYLIYTPAEEGLIKGHSH